MVFPTRCWLLGGALLWLAGQAAAQTSYNRWEAQLPAPVATPARPATTTPPASRTEGTVEVLTSPASPDSGKAVFAYVEVMPSFPGGQRNYQSYVRKNLKCPRGPKEVGKVWVRFTVLKSGAVTNVHVTPEKGINAAYDDAAVKLISKAPLFTPGQREGGIADMEVTYPVEFR